MIKSLILETMEEYQKKREKSKKELRMRKEKLYQNIPRLLEIELEMKRIGIQIIKSVQADPKQIKKQIKQLKEKTIDLQMERAEILASNGYPVDYLEIKYDCPQCQDTGYIGIKRCKCFEQRLIDKAYDQSNLHDLLEKENFDTFCIDYYSDEPFAGHELSPRKNIETILLDCITYANHFEHHNKNLFFYGSPGLGKTFLSHAIAKDVLEKGKIVLYQTASDLIDFIRKNKFDFDQSHQEETSLLERIFESDLLIIDDLGTEYLTEFAKMELFNVINKRLLTKKKMIISTNLSLRELQEKYPNRLTSRILGNFELYKFYGEDIRIKKLGNL
ncbi:ATP-binding protein [Garciella nitratireducens]|uniref:DNA replication protein DnaC n=1 Tax=Garciella nitratireducens DSM 15102 TaxID=1121911 RepID=A0A1T4M4R1_9FIRM|nr:ATP-binding protein [Garciella nitratireducens]SJZ61778.1 DNA replication protein DnaC [Garciella nitratireducens DSM 15102]